MELGRVNRLTVIKQVDFGLYLDGGEVHGPILLPSRYVPEGTKVGDELDVFIYLDQDERLVATTERPLAQVGDFAHLEVAWVNNFGAFLNWGLMKDLFVPFREQKMKMQKGNRYIVHIHLDERSHRIMASAKVEKFLSQDMPPYRPGDAVEVLVWQKTDLGLKAIVDNRFSGLLYDQQMFREPHTGDRLTAYVQQVRPDGKIDLILQPLGQQAATEFSEVLLQHLQTNGGHTPLGDKSPAEEIYAVFGVSKKVFKKAVGDLYRRRIITIGDDGLTLISED
ncbi:MAG: GntR family transcriptional regulator [Bacteroidaceae bacterium]|nr:GntR family transcriptional regulator [Bacteroidaceae bacterium]